MQVLYEIITAQASEGLSMNEEAPVNIPPGVGGEILITSALQQVSQRGANGGAQIAITSYIQDGQLHEGNWPLLTGKNITSVTGSLKVTSAEAVGTVVVLTL